MGLVCQKHPRFWGNFPLLSLQVWTTWHKWLLPLYTWNIERPLLFPCRSSQEDKKEALFVRRKTNMALRCFWQIILKVSSSCCLSCTRISQNVFYLQSTRHSEDRVVALQQNHRWQRCRRSIQRVLFCISEGNRLFRIYLYLYKHLDHKHLKHHR